MKEIQQIKLKPIHKDLGGELAEKMICECDFCRKKITISTKRSSLAEKLSGNELFCCFCLRHGLHTKNNKNILILSFKPIIAFYHDVFYRQKNRLYVSQIRDFVADHKATGLHNPLFTYDDDTFNWFIDFSKVGKGNKKIPLNVIHLTIKNILKSFELEKHIPYFGFEKLEIKYTEAVDKFHTQRYRPKNKRILMPSLHQCGGACDDKTIDHEIYKNFYDSRLTDI